MESSEITIDETNPLGIKGIDHLEFTCDKLETQTADLFRTLGFTLIGKNSTNNSELFIQNNIRFVLTANDEAQSHSRKYFNEHGEGVSKISFHVQNAELAIETAIRRGAKLKEDLKIVQTEHGVIKTASIQGFGDVLNEFVERPANEYGNSFTKLDNIDQSAMLTQNPVSIDHLTNNVPKGEMKHWVNFYKQIYGFKVTRYFDIKGQKTGLVSEVVQLQNGRVIIPINEPDLEGGKSQIQEFLDLHKGAGVQHIALTSPKIVETVEQLQQRGIKFLNIPHTYYEDLPKREFKVKEDLELLEQRQLLADGDAKGYLLQNFTQTYIGPLFFEYICRRNHMGFGEGNFQALFDAIERDQLERGYIK